MFGPQFDAQENKHTFLFVKGCFLGFFNTIDRYLDFAFFWEVEVLFSTGDADFSALAGAFLASFFSGDLVVSLVRLV